MATRTIDLGNVVGPPGPNSVSSTTATTLTGVLAGNGSTVEVKPVDATPTANSGNLVNSGGVAAKASSLAAGMAIIATGNTHAAITKGQYVYIQNHDTLPEGMYEATANVAANGTLSTSNVTAKTEGAANALKAAMTPSELVTSPAISPASQRCTINQGGYWRVGPFVVVDVVFTMNTSLSGNSWTLLNGFPRVKVRADAGVISSALLTGYEFNGTYHSQVVPASMYPTGSVEIGGSVTSGTKYHVYGCYLAE